MFSLARVLLLLATGAAAAEAPEPAAVAQTFQDLATATGFTIHRPVAFQVLTRQQVGRFLDDRVAEAVKPAEIRAEELTLKKFGFVPADFDLRKTTLALMTEQTAAFYDYHRRKLFLTDWTSPQLRSAAVAHELAHALADQNYPLERFAKRVERDSEKAAARQAVVEGQASWLMREMLRQHPAVAVTEPAQPDLSSDIFDQAPRYLQETLTFPYNFGTSFQQAVVERLGQAAFRRVFEKPPVSTQQILHPELYFAGLEPLKIQLPSLPGMKRLVEGPLGELEHGILLRQFTSAEDAQAVSPHWRGAKYQLWEDRHEERVALVYRSAWESEAWAQRYFALYKQVLRGKWKTVTVKEDTETNFTGVSESGSFRVDCAGIFVTSLEGLVPGP